MVEDNTTTIMVSNKELKNKELWKENSIQKLGNYIREK